MKEIKAEDFIVHEEIIESMKYGEEKAKDKAYVRGILQKSRECKGLTHREAAVLLHVEDEDVLNEMFKTAREIKEKIYGK
ncbi:MAG: [FeFe] hydrogenase H-cluster radical SAM maturase HydG, partial [Caloramator sp.]|nr:[FeFe] hydrogenase H-cluster radical SAM maturase HydG [Caloramator sp.]